MIKHFWQAVQEHSLISQGDRVVLGFSGGADSASLFHMLLNSGLDLKIMAVHVNHGLRGLESDGDEEFCADFAKKHGAEFKVYRANIAELAKQKGVTEEEAGRDYRYASFQDAAETFSADKIAVAHNMDDNAETILMRFFRGTGILGLAGIPIRRGIVVRPLLYANRSEIETYLTENNVPFRIDSTNAADIYTRNKLRNTLLPAIKELNPSVVQGITDAAIIFSAEDAFLDKLAKKAYADALININNELLTLSVDNLVENDPVILKRVIRTAFYTFSGSMKDLNRLNVDNIAELLHMERGKRINLPGGIIAIRGNGILAMEKFGNTAKINFNYAIVFSKNLILSEKSLTVTFNEEGEMEARANNLKKLYTILVKYDKMIKIPVFKLRFRTRLPGDFLYISGVGRQKLKVYLNSRKYSQKEKDDLFYFADGSEILAVLSEIQPLYVSDAFIINSHQSLSLISGRGFSVWGKKL